ncbi:putative holin-like toxin [Salipaludibacillus sp. LMS25]
MKGGGAMITVFEALTLMLSFGMFVIALLAFNHKK